MAQSFLNRTATIYVGEAHFIGINWAGKLAPGVTPVSGSSQALDAADDSDVSGTVLGSHVISGFLSVVLMSNVTAEKTYKVIITTTFSNGETWKERITLNAEDIAS